MALALVGYHGESTVIGRQYFLRQAATLLKSALSTNDPKLAATLVDDQADQFVGQVEDVGFQHLPLAQARAEDVSLPNQVEMAIGRLHGDAPRTRNRSWRANSDTG